MKIDTSIEYIPFQHISYKSPEVSLITYCDFGLFKIVLSKSKPTMIDGLWKIVKEEWKSISLKNLWIVHLSWNHNADV